jgi:hypothetical protein
MKHKIMAAVAVTALACVTGAAAWATPAELSQSADGSVCGQVTLAGTSGQHLGKYLLHWFVEEDTAKAGNLSLPGEKVITFDEDYGGGEVSVVYHATSPESDENLDPEEVIVDTDCAEPGTSTTTVPSTTTTVGPPSPDGAVTCEGLSPNIPKGSPHYASELDPDGDGFACEENTPTGPRPAVAGPAVPVAGQPQFTG